MNASGMYPMMWIAISSNVGGKRRLLRWQNPFLDKPYQELLESVEAIKEKVEEIQDTMDTEEEPDLYVSPLTALEQYEIEIQECKEWQEREPELWQTLFREEIDIETFAFYILPRETKNRLMN